MIEGLKQYKVDAVRCGGSHSFCRTQCGKHFLFGYNSYVQCLCQEDTGDVLGDVLSPYCIDEVVQANCGKKIVSVHPGGSNTIIICSSNDSE